MLTNLQAMQLTKLGRQPDPDREPRPPRHPEWRLWVTRDGQFMEISEMKYSHLCNSIRMVRRTFNLERYRMSCPPFPMFNGDMAQMFAENEWEREVDARLKATGLKDYDIFVSLCREHTRRLIELRRAMRAGESVSFT